MSTMILILAVALLASPGLREAFGKTVENQQATAGPHYSVVMTEAHNLLVTDNGANKLYFYTIDKDKPIGSPLKLRASIDLAQVGEEEVKITPHNLEKSDSK